MAQELNHHRLPLPDVKGLYWRPEVEVWDDEQTDQPPHVTIYIVSDSSSEAVYVELTPNEARIMAAQLINAAEHQERRSKNVG